MTPDLATALCETCKGDGFCVFCDGTGKREWIRLAHGAPVLVCASCEGTGRCEVCEGSGERT